MELITQLSRKHEEVCEEAIVLRSAVSAIGDSDKAGSSLKNLDSFLQRGIFPHFDFEEQKVFPVLLKSATEEEKQLIRALQEEHASILSKIERFTVLNSKYKSEPSRKLLEELSGAGKDIIDALILHARKEDKELFPILKNKGYKF